MESSRDKNCLPRQGTSRSGEGGKESLLNDPGSELRLGGRDNRGAMIVNGMDL